MRRCEKNIINPLRSNLREEEKCEIVKMYVGKKIGVPTIARLLRLKTNAVFQYLKREGLMRTKVQGVRKRATNAVKGIHSGRDIATEEETVQGDSHNPQKSEVL
jgi:hypothetical protein